MTQLLLIDDDPACLQALGDMLRIRIKNVIVHTADTVATGLGLMASGEYDTVVSDIHLPGMNGLELLERIKGAASELPVVLMTGYTDRTLEDRALRLGAYAVVQKPLDRDSFVAILTRAVRSAVLSRQGRDEQEEVGVGPARSRLGPQGRSVRYEHKGPSRHRSMTH